LIRAATAETVRITIGLERFWRSAHGWAPADMLAAARLDRQVSFARTLKKYRQPFSADSVISAGIGMMS
jgi:hypothetical protein